VRGADAPLELEEVPVPIAGGLEIHRKQLTFDYLDTGTGEVKRGQIVPADRAHLRAWLARFAGRTTSRSRWRGAPAGGMWPRSWPGLASRRMSPSRPTPRSFLPLQRENGNGFLRQ
jgi:hypothetical protein